LAISIAISEGGNRIPGFIEWIYCRFKAMKRIWKGGESDMARKLKTRTKSASTRKKPAAKRTTARAKKAPATCCTKSTPKEAPRFRLSPEHYGRLVREQAYYLWERRGRTHGRHSGDWHEAERIVRTRLSNN